jgi:hypothetical protein
MVYVNLNVSFVVILNFKDIVIKLFEMNFQHKWASQIWLTRV